MRTRLAAIAISMVLWGNLVLGQTVVSVIRADGTLNYQGPFLAMGFLVEGPPAADAWLFVYPLGGVTLGLGSASAADKAVRQMLADHERAGFTVSATELIGAVDARTQLDSELATGLVTEISLGPFDNTAITARQRVDLTAAAKRVRMTLDEYLQRAVQATYGTSNGEIYRGAEAYPDSLSIVIARDNFERPYRIGWRNVKKIVLKTPKVFDDETLAKVEGADEKRVRELLGEPSQVYPTSSDGTVWVYDRPWAGRARVFFLHGVASLRAADEFFDADTLAKVEGADEERVRELLGDPSQVFRQSGVTTWFYYRPEGSIVRVFFVHGLASLRQPKED